MKFDIDVAHDVTSVFIFAVHNLPRTEHIGYTFHSFSATSQKILDKA
jgi:hypothetical protein